jgi:hypothetical protein
MQMVELPVSSVVAVMTATAHGIGDIAPLPSATRTISGESLRPPSPCHLRASQAGSSVQLSWTRRSHRGWSWIDGTGVADDPFAERYRLTVTGPAGELITETETAAASFDVAELPAGAGHEITFAVATVGPVALSHPASVSFIL